MINLNINGKSHQVDVEPDTPLLWVIRDTIGMTGTKFGCGISPSAAPAPSMSTASRRALARFR